MLSQFFDSESTNLTYARCFVADCTNRGSFRCQLHFHTANKHTQFWVGIFLCEGHYSTAMDGFRAVACWRLPDLVRESTQVIEIASRHQGRFNDCIVSMEWGYKAHERGLNIQAAAMEFTKIWRGE